MIKNLINIMYYLIYLLIAFSNFLICNLLLFLVFHEFCDILLVQYKLVIIAVLPAGPANLSPESISNIIFGKRDQGDPVDPLPSQGIHTVPHHPASYALPAELLCYADMVETSLPPVASAQDRTDHFLSADRYHTCRGIPF